MSIWSWTGTGSGSLRSAPLAPITARSRHGRAARHGHALDRRRGQGIREPRVRRRSGHARPERMARHPARRVGPGPRRASDPAGSATRPKLIDACRTHCLRSRHDDARAATQGGTRSTRSRGGYAFRHGRVHHTWQGFRSVDKDGYVQLQLPDERSEQAVAGHPTGERLNRMGKPIGFQVPLAGVNGKDVSALVADSWARRSVSCQHAMPPRKPRRSCPPRSASPRRAHCLRRGWRPFSRSRRVPTRNCWRYTALVPRPFGSSPRSSSVEACLLPVHD